MVDVFNPDVPESKMSVPRRQTLEDLRIEVDSYDKGNYRNGVEAIAAVNSQNRMATDLSVRVNNAEQADQLLELESRIGRNYLDIAYDYAIRMEEADTERPNGEPTELSIYVNNGGYSKIRGLLKREGRTWSDPVWDLMQDTLWSGRVVENNERTISETESRLTNLTERLNNDNYVSQEEKEEDIILKTQYELALNSLSLNPEYRDALEIGPRVAKTLCRLITTAELKESYRGTIEAQIEAYSFLGLDTPQGGRMTTPPSQRSHTEEVIPHQDSLAAETSHDSEYERRAGLTQKLLSRLSRMMGKRD